MGKEQRNGKRKTRQPKLNQRIPSLGYYMIVTDTKETEKNYLEGLRNSISQELRERIVIKVTQTKTEYLVKEAIRLQALHPQYAQPWIVFDRDRVVQFNEIIHSAEEKGIQVGWSNPCLEIWFHAYFGSIPNCIDSVSCCNTFAKTYKIQTGHSYEKSDSKIYEKLFRFGDERNAIILSKMKHEEQIKNHEAVPSEMIPCSTIYRLVDEVIQKSKKE